MDNYQDDIKGLTSLTLSFAFLSQESIFFFFRASMTTLSRFDLSNTNILNLLTQNSIIQFINVAHNKHDN